MFEGQFIGRSVIKCLLIEQEDEFAVCRNDKENLAGWLRLIRLFFNTMDRLGIKRVHYDVYSDIMSIGYDDKEYIEKLANSDDAQIEEYEFLLEREIDEHPEYFEFGEPELEVECDESCRGTQKLISRDDTGGGVWQSVIVTTRPEKCLYKDWL